MANDALTAAWTAHRDVPAVPPGPFQDCTDVVHLSVFFDGTGNNKDADEATKKWSNVARLWRSAQLMADETKGRYAIYVSGPGTQFNGDATGWVDGRRLWAEDNLGGMGFGAGGDRRMAFGADNVNQRLRDVLIANARRQGGELAQYAQANSDKGFSEVNQKLGKHRLIKVINLSVFGFSRGAALARAFVNRVLASCERKGDQLLYQGYPIRMSFLGLFDTVASFGAPAQNVRLPWDERELIVPREVERCVHFVAAHELRYAFPVDLISQGGQLLGNWVETLYPGVHTDVGGGYEPINQGISNNYARVPMRDMMGEAVVHGVRMLSYAQVRQVNFPLFQERFECLPATEASYRAYRASVPQGGDLRSQRLAHMRLLYSAYGTLHRRQQRGAGDTVRDSSTWKSVFGPRGMAWEVNKYRTAAAIGRSGVGLPAVRLSDVANQYAQYIKPQDWQLQAWDTDASDAVMGFVRDFVHDSKVDFVGNVEPFSYFRLRTVQESTRSVWNETGDWIADRTHEASQAAQRGAQQVQRSAEQSVEAAKARAQAAQDAAKRAYEQAQAKAAETYDAAKHKSIEAYEAGKRQAQAAYEQARRAAEAAEQAVGRAIESAADAASARARAARDAAQRAYEHARAKSSEAYDAAKHRSIEAYEAGKRQAQEAYERARQAAEAAEREANRSLKEGRRIVEQGVEWIERQLERLH